MSIAVLDLFMLTSYIHLIATLEIKMMFSLGYLSPETQDCT